MRVLAYLVKAWNGLVDLAGRTRLINPDDVPVRQVVKDIAYADAHRLQKMDITVPSWNRPSPSSSTSTAAAG